MNARKLILMALLGLFLHPGTAQSQQTPPTPPRDEATLLRRRVVLLEDRMAALERHILSLEEALRNQRNLIHARQLPGPGPTYLRLDRDDAWRHRDNWRLLQRGHSQMEVRWLLGDPERVATEEWSTVWYYPGPGGGSVRFDALGGRVEAWSEPR